jgi:hypothetical protein
MRKFSGRREYLYNYILRWLLERVTAAYGKLLKSRLIGDAKNGSYLNCGLSPVPSFTKCGADTEQMAFFRSFIDKDG